MVDAHDHGDDDADPVGARPRGYAYINILGGAVFDVCVRFLHENPWERVGLLCDRLRRRATRSTRGQSLYTFELFPDDIVALNAQVLARLGVGCSPSTTRSTTTATSSRRRSRA